MFKHQAHRPADQTPVLLSRLLENSGFSHGFFTRNGGVSSGVFRSLNFAANTGDETENVEKNLSIVGGQLRVPVEKIYFLNQVHGTTSHLAQGRCKREIFAQQKGDIVLAKEPGIAAAIRTADCVPILIACRETGWVAACHSGWLGCERGAPIEAIRQLEERGARDLIAAIGPHISKEAFEVSEDVARRLVAASPDSDIADRSRDKPHIDLRKMVRSQLSSLGLSDAQIDDVAGCTVGEPETFFSYRRDKNPSGRLLSAISPR